MPTTQANVPAALIVACLATAMLTLDVVVVNTAIRHMPLTRLGFGGGRGDGGAVSSLPS